MNKFITILLTLALSCSAFANNKNAKKEAITDKAQSTVEKADQVIDSSEETEEEKKEEEKQ